MTLNVLFAAISERYDQYFAPLTAAFEKAGLDITYPTNTNRCGRLHRLCAKQSCSGFYALHKVQGGFKPMGGG